MGNNINQEQAGWQPTTTAAAERQQESNENHAANENQQIQAAGPESTERVQRVSVDANEGESSARMRVMEGNARTLLQRLRDGLRRRFGQDVLLPEGGGVKQEISQIS